jgi:hypothetical protein
MSKEHDSGNSGLENHDSGMASKDSNDESRQREPLGQRAVQLLAICANFSICEINGYDWHQGRCIYVQREGKYKRYILATLYYTSIICFMSRTY